MRFGTAITMGGRANGGRRHRRRPGARRLGRGLAAFVGLAAFLAVVPLATDAQAADGGLVEVRVGNDGAFDRVVFEFDGTTTPTVSLKGPMANPGTVDFDPSGMPVPVAGAQLVTVVMRGVFAAPDYTGPHSILPTSTANVVQVVETGDFEAVLQWSIGYRTAATPVVSVIADPVRVVVDIPHATAPTTARPTATTARAASATPTFTG